jgi:hypothetical protein
MTASQLEKGTIVEVEGYLTPTKEGVIDKEEDQDSTESPQHAFKGDDSEGKIAWTFRTVLAAISLSGLYTGKSCQDSSQVINETQTIFSLSDPSVLHWRHLGLHHTRYWGRTSNRVDSHIISRCPVRNRSFCRISRRSNRSTAHWHLGLHASLHRVCAHGHYALLRTGCGRNGPFGSRSRNFRANCNRWVRNATNLNSFSRTGFGTPLLRIH